MTVLSSSSLEPSYGFHRTFTTVLTPETPNWVAEVEEARCSIHLYYKFPVLVFVDPYELANYNHIYTFEHYGNANLELPVAAMESEGTSVLLTLAKPNSTADSQAFRVQVPLHIRYGKPSYSNETHSTAEIEWPQLFILCPSSVSLAKVLTLDLDPQNLLPPREFASLFEGLTGYVPRNFDPDAARELEVVTVPVGQYADVFQVKFGTAMIILAMFVYIGFIMYRISRGLVNRAPVKED
ncbi:hypothetical protein D9757_007545 [Collybiopsis confluens]|uniref:Protein PBN1 n=1 Tax=Collybiopsis confluens TaxID=2823264 RepID=A0A8H5M5W9_9AGAR|nr:hypothetical protein D9757_007545 [Collybiopsis confluens]